MARTVSVDDNTIVAGNIIPLRFDSGELVVILVPVEVAMGQEEAARWIVAKLNSLAATGEGVVVESVEPMIVSKPYGEPIEVEISGYMEHTHGPDGHAPDGHTHGPEPGSGTR